MPGYIGSIEWSSHGQVRHLAGDFPSVSHVHFHIGGDSAQAAFRRLMAAAPKVIIDYGKPYDGDFEFRPNPFTPKRFKCVGEEDCDGSY